jgi:hypothetical protein
MYTTNVSCLIDFLFSPLHDVAHHFQRNIQQCNNFNVSSVDKIKEDERNIQQTLKNEKMRVIF